MTKITKHYTRMTNWKYKLDLPEEEHEVWEVENPRGYSARFGTVSKFKDEIWCSCIQWDRYDHCNHVDEVVGHPYMKGQELVLPLDKRSIIR